ncbi:MAG TPA: UbiD family decarboxylase, partial [Dehalococcoidia bacterium]|nr:UbiD family decarboxylase [Dehalococcoidia bacterium]
MDLRQYIQKLAELGQLAAVEEEVDWNLQASALAAMSNRIGGPALQFKNIKGYPGMGLVSGLFTGPANVHLKREKPWSRHAVAAGLDLTAPWEKLVGRFMEAAIQRIPPVQVTSGPCKEKTLLGREAQITKLPIPYLHQGDGGRYGSLSALTVKDPETGWQYWGFHRWMVVSPHELTGPLEPVIGPFMAMPPYHLTVIAQKYHARGEAMPFCIILGGDPALFLASCVHVLFGFDQMGLAGGLRR